MVANIDFLERKNISKKLIFTKAMNLIRKEEHDVEGNYALDEMMPSEAEEPIVYVEDRETSWERFISDIKTAKSKVHIDVPDVIDDNDEAIAELIEILANKKAEGLEICIRLPEAVDVPEGLQEYTRKFGYVTNPVTIIDKKIVWFGQPLYAADFISEGEILDTEYFPCMRFIGAHTARSIQAFLEM